MDNRNKGRQPRQKSTLWIALGVIAAILLFGWLLSNQFRQRAPVPPPPGAGADVPPPPTGDEGSIPPP